MTSHYTEPRGGVRTALDWEPSVPRCETCVHHRGEPEQLQTVCKRGNFYTRPTAVCRHWMDRNGEVLSSGEKE
jgi:hypothetical protein